MKLFATLALMAACTASAASYKKPISYENVPGFFKQDLESTDVSTFDYISENFGLLDTFAVSGLKSSDIELRDAGAPWKKFQKAISILNRKAPRGTSYKVLFLARHGQGYHNVAESFYGTHLWDCYWSMLDGNGTSVWADAQLTDAGILEAQKANAAWKTQRKAGVPLPESYYSSPLSRAASTLQITWSDITLNAKHPPKPVIKEKFRETIGIHTCDRRSVRSALSKKYPAFTFEKSFSEADELWFLEWRESNDARNVRVKEGLDEVVRNDDATYITLSAHGGAITSVLEVVGHRAFSLKTGAMIPVVVKVEVGEEPTPVTSIAPSGTAPVCTVNPTPSTTT